MAGMDIGAVLAASAGAVAGGLATAVGGLVRNRGNVRTAARLIYAELTRNGAAVAYFRVSGSWPITTLVYTAWDEHGKALAQMRRSRAFDAVHRGYAALEAVQYIAVGTGLAESQSGDLLDQAVQDLAEAVRAIGEVAQIPRSMMEAEVKRLSLVPLPAESAVGRLTLSGAVPPFVLAGIVDRGGVELQLTASRSQVPAAGLQHSGLPGPARDGSATRMRFLIYGAAHRESLDELTLIRSTGDPPTGDPDVDDTYDAMVATHAFVREVLVREFIGPDERPMAAIVHYGNEFNNAFWNGEMIVVGDGDGHIFRRFGGCPDIIAHELFHAMPGVGDLTFWGQSGALVESICDVFASLVIQYGRRQTAAEASWILGENLLAEEIAGAGLRSLKAPGTAYDDPVLGKDPQVGHMDEYVETRTDNGGVHINCGIPNRAFHLLATALGGHAWERAGRIWYEAVTGAAGLTQLDFPGFAGRTIGAARQHYGAGSPELRATQEAWQAVGVRTRAS
ncbi:M4 family metallopeptidase [Actinomadura scrupuli]|uniref:M4 family metallopeptidase n=1 Tax=Actinomadura scrupuli TaxID=559629 RepID=UPI003D9697A6